MSTRQGKCTGCRLVWEWRGKPKLADARCGDCGRPLARPASMLADWPRRYERPAVQAALPFALEGGR